MVQNGVEFGHAACVQISACWEAGERNKGQCAVKLEDGRRWPDEPLFHVSHLGHHRSEVKWPGQDLLPDYI